MPRGIGIFLDIPQEMHQNPKISINFENPIQCTIFTEATGIWSTKGWNPEFRLWDSACNSEAELYAWTLSSSHFPSLLNHPVNPTNQQHPTPSTPPPLLAVGQSHWIPLTRPCWPLPPWPAVVPKLRGPRSWLGQWHCSGCPCRRSGFLEV